MGKRLHRGLLFIAALALAVAGCQNINIDDGGPEPPDAPGDWPSQGVTTTYTITVTWTAVADATSYNLYWAAGPTVSTAPGGYDEKITGLTGTSRTISALDAYSEYHFMLTAVGDAGESDPGPALQLWTAPIAPPDAPTLGQGAADSIVVGWTPAGGAVVWMIFWKETAADFNLTDSGVQNRITMNNPETITTGAGTFSFKFTAINACGSSDPSPMSTITTD
jgi:hypothetical protein